ncbi:MAG: hypothetical protein IRY94_20670 [Rhodospirillaceae bacterium]|nr:hypothetical protein [Rhodospirillaceae bacterium]
MLKAGLAMLAGVLVLTLAASDAAAEKVRGKESCVAEKNDRTINGKKYTCSTKCTTPVTDTTCTGGACSTTVYNEVTYKDCEEKAVKGVRGQLQQLTIQPQVMSPGTQATTPVRPGPVIKGTGTMLQQ